MSTLGFAILGLLVIEPRTGYELAQAMKAPIGYMWTAQHSQIYTELGRLQTAGLVASEVIDGPGPRDTKRYSITASGRASLVAWVDAPLKEVARSEVMLRVRALWLLSPSRARRFIAGYRQTCVDRLQILADEEADFEPMAASIADPTTQTFDAYATLRFGMARARASLEWCDWMLEQLPDADRTADEPGPPPAWATPTA